MSDDEEEVISYNGRDLEGSSTYRFTLESADGDLWSLDDHYGKVVILVFMFTRCDETCPVTSQNIQTVQDTLTEDELEQISIVSVTVDWRTDSPSKLQNWTEERGYDWPHLTGGEEYLKAVYENYGVFPYEQDDDSEEGYTVAHPSPTYILDTSLKGRVVWSDYDFPVDLFIEDIRTVLKHH
jgi:cytochrome oxidase Cu insertion factor (SCO1/SenC/PrrC family)